MNSRRACWGAPGEPRAAGEHRRSEKPAASPRSQVDSQEFAAIEQAFQALERAGVLRAAGASAPAVQLVKADCTPAPKPPSPALPAAATSAEPAATSGSGFDASGQHCSVAEPRAPLAAAAAGANSISEPSASGAAAAALPAVARRKLPLSLLDPNAAATFSSAAGAAAAPTSLPPPPSCHSQFLQPLAYNGLIRYACSEVEVSWLCQQLAALRPDVVGLDIEWRPTFVLGQSPPKAALIQLAYVSCTKGGSGSGGVRGAESTAREQQQQEHYHSSRCCTTLLLHVAHSGVPPALRALLEAEVPTKVGVNIGGDAQKLAGDYGLKLAGCVDLSTAANGRVIEGVNIPLITTTTMPAAAAATAPGGDAACCWRRFSLAGLVEAVLFSRLDKNNRVRCGNWEARPLDAAQQRYAALDAYAGLAVHLALQRLPSRPPPPPPALPAATSDAACPADADATADGGPAEDVGAAAEQSMQSATAAAAALPSAAAAAAHDQQPAAAPLAPQSKATAAAAALRAAGDIAADTAGAPPPPKQARLESAEPPPVA